MRSFFILTLEKYCAYLILLITWFVNVEDEWNGLIYRNVSSCGRIHWWQIVSLGVSGSCM